MPRRAPKTLWQLLGPRRAIAAFTCAGILLAGFVDAPTQLLGLSPAAGVAFTLLLTAAVMWVSELVPLFVTSFVILLGSVVWLAPRLPDPSPTRFLAPFSSNIILLFLGGFVLSVALHKYLLDERLARWVLRRTGTKPSRVLLGTMLVSAFLSMWMSNTATTAMMLALALPLLAGVAEGDPFRRALLLGIPFAANLGGLGTPIGTPPNAIAIRYLEDMGAAPSFAQWMLLTAPVLYLGLFILWRLLLALHPTELRDIDMGKAPNFRWSVRSRAVVVVTLLTVTAWLTADLHGVPSGMVALVPVIVFFGTGLLETADFRGLSWDVLFIVGGGLCLGVAVTSSGLSDWLVALVPTEGVSSFALVAVLVLSSGLLTSVMSNTATANLLVPVVMGLATDSLAGLLIAVAHGCSLAMALPVSTPPNAMVFSSGQVTVKDMLVPGLLFSLVALALACTVGFWWWALLGYA